MLARNGALPAENKDSGSLFNSRRKQEAKPQKTKPCTDKRGAASPHVCPPRRTPSWGRPCSPFPLPSTRLSRVPNLTSPILGRQRRHGAKSKGNPLQGSPRCYFPSPGLGRADSENLESSESHKSLLTLPQVNSRFRPGPRAGQGPPASPKARRARAVSSGGARHHRRDPTVFPLGRNGGESGGREIKVHFWKNLSRPSCETEGGRDRGRGAGRAEMAKSLSAPRDKLTMLPRPSTPAPGREGGGTRRAALGPGRGGMRSEQKPLPTHGPRGPLTFRQQLHRVSEGRVERVLFGHEFGQVLVLRLHLARGRGGRRQQRGRRRTTHCRVGTRGRGRQQRRRLRGGVGPAAPPAGPSASPGPERLRRLSRQRLTHRGVDT